MGTKAKKYFTTRNLLILLLLIGMGFGAYFLWTTYLSPAGDTTTTVDASTFVLYANDDTREDVSNFVPISVWLVDPDSDFDPTNEEHLNPDTMTDYFTEEKASIDADDVEIDLSEETWFWVEIDPDDETVFENDFHRGYGGSNGVIELTAYHLSSNCFFENNKLTDGTRGVPTSNGNYTITLTGFPKHATSWANYHVGSDWATSLATFNDYSADKQAEFLDEELWTSQAPTYTPETDDDKDYENGLELYTEVFAYKFAMNDTIGDSDSVTGVNCTVDNSNVEVLTSGEYLYLAFTMEVVPTYALDYELQLGADITCSNLYSGRLTVPDDDNSGLSFSAYSYSL